MKKGIQNLDAAVHETPVPPGGVWATLGQVTESMKNGIYRPASSYSEDGIPCLRMYNIDQGKIVWRDIKRMLLSEEEVSDYELLPGDLLVNRVNSRELVGKTVAIPDNLGRCVFESKNIRVRLRKEFVIPEYACYYLLAEGSRYFMQNAQQVVGMASINQAQVASFPLPLAPVQEQRRIVAELEKQFTRLDAGVAALRRIQAELKRYRAAVLKAACEGQLVPNEAQLAKAEGRSMETGEALLTRILNDRRQNWQGRGKYKEPLPAKTNGLSKLPDGWTWATVGQITESHDGRRVPLKVSDRDLRSGPYPYYGASGIIDDIDHFLFDGEYLLIAEDGANLLSRNTPIAFKASGRFWVNNHAHVVQTYGGVPLAFLAIYLNGNDLSFLITGSAQPKLTKGALDRLVVPLPPLTEITRIVAEVERRISVVVGLETIARDNLHRAARMRQAVLHLAFRGQLVEQDACDEPVDLNSRAKETQSPPMSTQRNKSSKKPKTMPRKPTATLNELLECLDTLGGSSAPQRLFMALEFGNDVEAFFDLLRQGKSDGALNVPVGIGGNIRRASHAS